MSDASRQNGAPVRLGWWLSSEEHDPRALVRHAVAAEDAGVTTAMISDHLQPWTRAQNQSSCCWTVLGALAEATSRLEVGTGVTAIVHRQSPIGVAHAAATASVMLDERFFLGVGTGERLNEQPFGIRWPGADERRELLAEAVELVRRLFGGETVDHRGTHFTVEQLRLATRPSMAPPILVACAGPRSAKLAGEIGDGMIAVAPDARLVDVFHAAGGRGKRCVGQLHVSLAESEDEARDQAWRWWPNAVVPAPVLTELATPMDFEAVAAAIGPATLGETIVCATGADAIVAAIDRFVGAGFDTVYLHQVGPDQRRLLDLLRSELLGHFGAGNGSGVDA